MYVDRYGYRYRYVYFAIIALCIYVAQSLKRLAFVPLNSLCHEFMIIDKHFKQCSLSMTEPVILARGVGLGHFGKWTSIVGSTLGGVL